MIGSEYIVLHGLIFTVYNMQGLTKMSASIIYVYGVVEGFCPHWSVVVIANQHSSIRHNIN